MNYPFPSKFRTVRLYAAILLTLMLSQWLHAIPLRVLAWNDEIAACKLMIDTSKGPAPIEGMHPSKRTKEYQVTSGEKPVTIQALDKIDKGGKPLASAVIIPKGTKQALLLLLPDAKADTGLRLFVLEDDVANFPWGGIRFINACGRKLAFVYEKKTIILPVSWTPVLAKPGGTNRNMETQLFLFEQPDRPIYSAVWEQQQDVRTLIFIVPGTDPRLGPVAMKMISEDRRVEEATEGTADSSRSARGR